MKNAPKSPNLTLLSPNCCVIVAKSGFERLGSLAGEPFKLICICKGLHELASNNGKCGTLAY